MNSSSCRWAATKRPGWGAILVVAAVALLGGPAVAQGTPTAATSTTTTSATTTSATTTSTTTTSATTTPTAQADFGILGEGSWNWFGDPRAVQLDDVAVAPYGPTDVTYVGWIDWTGNITIAAYSLAFGLEQTSVVGQTYVDDHVSPSIIVEPDMHLTVFWSDHDGSEMFYRTTLAAENISNWGPVQEIPTNVPGSRGYTYPNPILLPAEDKLYLFWRGGDWSADYATLAPGGTWSAARRLIVVDGERPYVKYDSNGSNEIAIAFTNGHPRETLTSIYYVEYRHGSLWTAAGRWVARIASGGISLAKDELVYNARRSHVHAWVWDVAFDSYGDPVIVYATFPSPENAKYWYARWNGKQWVNYFLSNAGPSISPGTIEAGYSGGITLDHSDPSVVFLSRQAGNGFEIERWVTPNGGASWQVATVVPSDGTDNVRPVVPRGSGGAPMSLLWLRGDYGSYYTYRTSIAYLK